MKTIKGELFCPFLSPKGHEIRVLTSTVVDAVNQYLVNAQFFKRVQICQVPRYLQRIVLSKEVEASVRNEMNFNILPAAVDFP
jgi:hypothetical protein